MASVKEKTIMKYESLLAPIKYARARLNIMEEMKNPT